MIFLIENDSSRAVDQVLTHIALILTEHTRESDIIARICGEEFAILLLHTDKNGAVVIAEKLQKLTASPDAL